MQEKKMHIKWTMNAWQTSQRSQLNKNVKAKIPQILPPTQRACDGTLCRGFEQIKTDWSVMISVHVPSSPVTKDFITSNQADGKVEMMLCQILMFINIKCALGGNLGYLAHPCSTHKRDQTVEDHLCLSCST